MPRRPKVPPAEVSLAEVAAGVAEVNASIAEMQRDRKRDAAKREAERAADRAERKREIAERKAEREAERAEREAERAERKAAEAASKARYDRMEEQSAKFREEWGVYTSNESEEVEDQIYNALDESKQIGDLRFDHVNQNICGVVDGEPHEYDIVAENGKVTVVLEVKHKLTLSDVRRFAKKHLPLFSKAFPGLAKNKDVIGAMAYQSVRDRKKTVQEALDFGLLLLRAEGKKGLRQIKTVADSDRPSKRGKS